MKIKIIFSEPPHATYAATEDDEQIIVIQSPYKVTQEKPGDERVIQTEDGVKVNYETYCAEMEQLIAKRLASRGQPDTQVIEKITLIGFQQPPIFKSLCDELEKSLLVFASMTQLVCSHCLFSGALYVDSISKIVNTAQKRQKMGFKIYIEESGQPKLSSHDEARLASLREVRLYRNKTSTPSIRPFLDDSLCASQVRLLTQKIFSDDSLVGIAKIPLQARLKSPTYFYRSSRRGATAAEEALKNFFSQAAQQQNDYTCGPATLKMVAAYYVAISSQRFCGEPVANAEIWCQINTMPEMELAAKVKTTEAEGSGIREIRDGLMALGLRVFDDDGLSTTKYNEKELSAHKELLWDKMKEILKRGIPIILNMQDRDRCGHYEVVIGIENTEQGEQIILAEPGTGLSGTLEFETISKAQFLPRWKNMSGEFHGRFIILPPNEASAGSIEKILTEIPHCMNGKNRYRVDDGIKQDL